MTERERFEKWMKKTYDEPEWDEGWNREDLFAAWLASIVAAVDEGFMPDTSREKKIEQAYNVIMRFNREDPKPYYPYYSNMAKEIIDALEELDNEKRPCGDILEGYELCGEYSYMSVPWGKVLMSPNNHQMLEIGMRVDKKLNYIIERLEKQEEK